MWRCWRETLPQIHQMTRSWISAKRWRRRRAVEVQRNKWLFRHHKTSTEGTLWVWITHFCWIIILHFLLHTEISLFTSMASMATRRDLFQPTLFTPSLDPSTHLTRSFPPTAHTMLAFSYPHTPLLFLECFPQEDPSGTVVIWAQTDSRTHRSASTICFQCPSLTLLLHRGVWKNRRQMCPLLEEPQPLLNYLHSQNPAISLLSHLLLLVKKPWIWAWLQPKPAQQQHAVPPDTNPCLTRWRSRMGRSSMNVTSAQRPLDSCQTSR